MVAQGQSGWWRFKRAVSPKPVAIRHEIGLLVDVARLALAFVAGVEAIYLSDLVINRILPRVLDSGASLANVLVLVILSMPSCLYIALPIAVLASVYFVVLRRREAREFIVFAGMGRGVGRILVFAVTVGAAALVLSLFLSGYVEPLSRYEASRTMFDVRFEAIRNGAIGAGKFYHHNDFTMFAGNGQTRNVADRVFFLQDLGGDSYQLVTASQSHRLDQPAMTSAGVLLHMAAIYDFDIRRQNASNADALADCETCSLLSIVPGGAHATSQILVDMPNLTFPDSEPRGSKVGERTSLEMLNGDLWSNAVIEELGDRLFRGLLVFVAPMLAVLAVSLTQPAWFLAALPAAASLVLAGSFFGSRLVAFLAPLGLVGLVAVLLGGTIALTALAVSLVFRFENGCIQHGGVQL